MATLNSWQRIDRVLAGKPWGDGASGSATVSSDPNTRATFSGTATQTTGTAGSSAFANGDVVMLHQTQGTGVGQWEINKVASGGGSTSLTFSSALNYTYGTGAQIIKIPRYTTATVSAHSVTGWNGSTGGIEVICAKTSITVSGNVNTAGLGFAGGNTGGSGDTQANDQGDGTAGVGTQSHLANGNGGGGGGHQSGTGDYGGGGGGGNGTAGGTPVSGGGKGAGGSAVGSADLITMDFGGGGGAGGIWDSPYYTYGGAGGGIIVLISLSISLSAYAYAYGGAGQNKFGVQTTSSGGGGGAGGSILCVCKDLTGGAYLNATGGAGGSGSNSNLNGGTGGTGRIAVHHSGTISGTSSPAYTDVSDATLVEVSGGPKFINFI